MKRACIAIVDAAHARLFTYQQVEADEPTLREERDLVSAGRQMHDMFSDSKPGNRWQEGGRGSTDDHRTAHLAEMDSKFAKRIVEEVTQLVREQGFHHVIIVASPKMLGTLRQFDGALRRNDLIVDEVAQDLAWLSPPQVHDHLAAMKLIDPRPRATLPRGARR
ncbi:MAG: host attachment protein [Deltaproteobacteria bacterium]|nr:host attachment protein [Deltaproteobacteria bacterium]MDQ3295449.1 host attachment protein [Myxococcota bacterium]